jgi:tripartite-type tricarboxylate transporter receptor subunit TctC
VHRRLHISRRSVSLAIGVALLPAAAARAQPAAWPERTIRLVVPFGPGGTADLIARLIREPLAQQLGQPVVVENRAGAGGALGTEWVAKSGPDGYTIAMATQSTHAANPALNPKLAYDPLRDFAPISMLAVVPGVLAVHPSLPAQTMPELIALIRHNPGKLSYGTPGIGSLGHLLMAQFEQLHQLELVHVPYRSGAALLTDALSGQLQIVGDNLLSALPYLRAGRLRALAVLAPHRVALLPDVPTYAELGYGEIGKPAWFGLVAPALTPPAVIERINGAVRAVMKQPEVLATLAQSNSEPAAGTPEEFARAIRTTLEAFRAVVAERDIKLE